MIPRLAFLILIVGVCNPLTAQAHSVSTTHGVVSINDNLITAGITIPALDILHYAGGSLDDLDKLSPAELRALATKFAPQIGNELIIRDTSGRHIALTRVMAVSDSFNNTADLKRNDINKLQFIMGFEYQLAERPDYLTLQQRFFTSGPMHESQLSLNVKANSLQTGSAHVILTNRGNTETVAIAWPPPGSKETRITNPPRFSNVMAQMWIGEKDITVEIDIPLPLLETWMTLKRADSDLVNAAECATIETDVRSLITGKNQLKADGRAVTPEIAAIGFLSPDVSKLPVTLESGKARGYYITRAAVRLRYALDVPPQKVEYDWDLFNNAILEAELNLYAGGTTTQHTLTKYSPKLVWDRP